MRDSVHDIRQRLLIARLPAMPEILVKVIQLCQRDEAGMSDLAALIARDSALASKILSAAGSSLYASSGRKPGLMQALQTLGVEATKTLLICESVFQVFNGLADARTTDLRGFWRHSLLAACCARRIAEATAYAHLEEAYLAGLLHDVGRLALLSAAPREYAPLANHIDDASLCVAEERLLSISHVEAGALLIGRWSLDSYLADSVLYHHQPAQRLASTHPLIRTVMLADTLACQGASRTADLALTLCGIDAAALARICGEAANEVAQAAEALGLDLGDAAADMLVSLPAGAPDTPREAQRQLELDVQQLALNSAASGFYSRPTEVAGVVAAVAESAALLFGFQDVMVLLRDDAASCLRAAAATGRADRGEFMMPLDDGGAVSVAMAQGQIAFIESDTRLPSLSDERQLLLQVCKGKVKPNLRAVSAAPAAAPFDEPGRIAATTLSLAEEQLLRLLDAEYLACLPLLHDGSCAGVLIGAAIAIQVGELQLRETFLSVFAGQAAAAIAAAGSRAEQDRLGAAQLAAEYRQASRRVVHEINNPLSIIKNYLAVLGDKLARQEPVAAELAILGAELDRAGQLLRGLAEIKPAPKQDLIEVDAVVGEAVKFFSASLPVQDGVRVVTRLEAGKAKLKGDPDALKQILLNLVKNAREAMLGKGEIVVATAASINRDGRLHCSLTVEDNGPGIAPELLAKLFAPLDSSKAGPHMGLGLSIVHDLVKRLGGVITCRSGRSGTLFEILLPLWSDAPGDIHPVYSAH